MLDLGEECLDSARVDIRDNEREQNLLLIDGLEASGIADSACGPVGRPLFDPGGLWEWKEEAYYGKRAPIRR